MQAQAATVRLQHACGCPQGCAVLWEEEGWRVRVLLEWQRLVNGGRVMAKRSGTVGVMGAQLRRPSEDAERDAQHVQPDAHEAGASGSCDAVTLDMTEASPRSQVPAVETCINASVTRTRRTDTTLTLRYAARVQLTGHLDGRLAHARRKPLALTRPKPPSGGYFTSFAAILAASRRQPPPGAFRAT